MKAGNNREIARSCDFESETKTLEKLNYITQYNLSFEETLNEVLIKDENEDIQVQVSEPLAEISENLTITIEPETKDEYLDDDNYFSHNRLWNEFGETGYAKFSHTNGKSYFVVYNPDQSIYLRSKGFDSFEVRDAEL